MNRLVVALVCIAITGCGSREEYPAIKAQGNPPEQRPLLKVEDQPVQPIASSDGKIEKSRTEQLLASLPQDKEFDVVTGEVLKEISKDLNGRFIRVDAVLVDLSPSGAPWDMSVSAFETRDRSFPFNVAWSDSPNNTQEIRRHKQKIEKELKADKRGSKFRLYGRWLHEDKWLVSRRILTIEDWQLVEW